MSPLLAKKLALAFVLGFLPVLALGVLDLLDNIQEATTERDLDPAAWGWFLLSLVTGAISAGIRAVVVALNWMPTDSLHSPNKSTESITVTTES